MNMIGITSTAVLSLILAIAAPAYARQGQEGKQDHPKQQQNTQERAKPRTVACSAAPAAGPEQTTTARSAAAEP